MRAHRNARRELGRDFVEFKEYKFIKSKQIIIFANGSELVLNLNNLIGSKIRSDRYKDLVQNTILFQQEIFSR